MAKRDEFLSIRLSKALRAKIVKLAKKDNRSLASMVDILLTKVVKEWK